MRCHAGETLIPATLTTAVKGCGRALDPSSDHEDLQSGTAVELPLWLLPRFTEENWAGIKCGKQAASQGARFHWKTLAAPVPVKSSCPTPC